MTPDPARKQAGTNDDGMGRMVKGFGGAALAVALAGTALGSGPAAAQAPAEGAFSGNVVRIGVLNDQSGLYAEFGGTGSVEAAKMAVEDMGGKVGGVPIEIVSADHQNKPDIASAIARQWYDRDGVDAIMELTTSSVALAVQGLSKEKKKITITTGRFQRPHRQGLHPLRLPLGLRHPRARRRHRRGADPGGGKTWFFLTADYAFGTALENDTSAVVKANGGSVVGSVRHPLSGQDFSSFLLQAQGSKAQVIGLANAGLDTSNSIKQAAEYGITDGGQKLAALLFTLSEVHGLGIKAAQGLTLTEAWYWDLNDETRAFGQRFMKRTGRMPNMIQTGTYSAVLSYLKAVKAAGTDETDAVNAKLKALPVDDVFTHNGHVQQTGLMVHDMYLFEIKKPADSKGEWDLYKLVSTIPGKEAYATEAQSGCPMVAGK